MSPFAIPQVGTVLQEFGAFDFSGGLDIKTAPTKLAQMGAKNKWLTKATNVVLDTGGAVRKRWGMRDVSSAAGLDDLVILGGYRFRTSNGTIRDMVATSTGIVYEVATNGSLTSKKTGLTSVRSHSFATYNDILHMANGTDAPQQYDGTTWAALGGSSPATAAVFVAHGNRMFATATAVPSRLYWSKLNTSTDWAGTTDAGFLDVNPNDNAIILPLVSSIQELVIVKENRPYRLQGIGPATGYTVVDNLVPTTGSVGSNSTRGAAFAMNDVWYVSNLGVHRMQATQAFGDLTESFVSDPVEPYFRANSTIVDPFVATSSGYLSVQPQVHYDRSTNMLFVAGKTQSGSTYVDRILAYDLGVKAWTAWTLGSNMEFSAMWAAQHRTSLVDETWLALHDLTTNDAQVVAFDRSSSGDYGLNQGAVAISAQVRHVSHLGAPGVEKTPRRLYLYFAKEASSTTMTLNLYLDFRTTAAFTTTFDITSSTAETQVVKRIDLPSGLACEYLEVDLTQATVSRSFTFYGYQVQFRSRRRIRRAE